MDYAIYQLERSLDAVEKQIEKHEGKMEGVVAFKDRDYGLYDSLCEERDSLLEGLNILTQLKRYTGR